MYSGENIYIKNDGISRYTENGEAVWKLETVFAYALKVFLKSFALALKVYILEYEINKKLKSFTMWIKIDELHCCQVINMKCGLS